MLRHNWITRYMLCATVFLGHMGSGLPSLAQSRDIELGSAPAELEDGWLIGSAGAAGFKDYLLDGLTRSIRNGNRSGTHAVLIEKDGRLVYEVYSESYDQGPNGVSLGHVIFEPTTLHDLRSVSKSVTSALLGIALGTDFDVALATPLPEFFPDIRSQFGADAGMVTLEHTLTMTAGLRWNQFSAPAGTWEDDEFWLDQFEEPISKVLSRPLVYPPGTKWTYSSGLTEVLVGIIERRSRRSLDQFAEEALFKPLGITDYEWVGASKWRGGTLPSGAWGLRLTARDLAKIGSLYLHRGQWHGRQVIPADWVARSVERHVEKIPSTWADGINYGYGYQWIVGETRGFPSYKIIRAAGNGDQAVFILPEQKIVVTIFAGLYDQRQWVSGGILRTILGSLE